MNDDIVDINFVDNFLTKTEHRIVHEYCLSAPYYFGESDREGQNYTGMVHNIPETEIVYKILNKKVADSVEKVRNMKLYRMYINHFAPGETANFHVDGDGITFLYYPNMIHILDEGGETQFLVNDNIQGIIPRPNRIVMFDGNILHRATPFKNNHRFTLAIKYS